MSAYAKDEKIETISVQMKTDDVCQAVIDAARRIIERDSVKREINTDWAPQVIKDDYGGYTVYFRAADPKALKVAS